MRRGVKLVGLDYLSVAHADEQVPVHRAFQDHGVVLLEGIDLSEVAPGRYELICFPIRLRGADGAPCRAVSEAARIKLVSLFQRVGQPRIND